MVTITYFYDDDSAPIDIDNIPKPILDALKDMVYLDDNQVTDLICRKRDLNGHLEIEYPTEALTQSFSSGDEFLYVQVEDALVWGVRYGR